MKLIPRCIKEKMQFYFILLYASPVIYAFQMFVVFPRVAEIINAGPIEQCIHACFATLCLINVCGNLLMSVMSKLNIEGVLCEDSIYCEFCQILRPTNSWHCRKCNTCILKRDHHCGFFNRCVGLFNKRYYMMFLAHVAVSMLYAAYYNFYWIASKYEDSYGIVITIGRMVNPFLRFLTIEQSGEKELCVVYLCLNVGFASWAGSLFYYHFKNAIMGVTAYDNKYNPEFRNIRKWRQNLIGVFGLRWYWAIVWPFCSSPLPLFVKNG